MKQEVDLGHQIYTQMGELKVILKLFKAGTPASHFCYTQIVQCRSTGNVFNITKIYLFLDIYNIK